MWSPDPGPRESSYNIRRRRRFLRRTLARRSAGGRRAAARREREARRDAPRRKTSPPWPAFVRSIRARDRPSLPRAAPRGSRAPLSRVGRELIVKGRKAAADPGLFTEHEGGNEGRRCEAVIGQLRGEQRNRLGNPISPIDANAGAKGKVTREDGRVGRKRHGSRRDRVLKEDSFAREDVDAGSCASS